MVAVGSKKCPPLEVAPLPAPTSLSSPIVDRRSSAGKAVRRLSFNVGDRVGMSEAAEGDSRAFDRGSSGT